MDGDLIVTAGSSLEHQRLQTSGRVCGGDSGGRGLLLIGAKPNPCVVGRRQTTVPVTTQKDPEEEECSDSRRPLQNKRHVSLYQRDACPISGEYISNRRHCCALPHLKEPDDTSCHRAGLPVSIVFSLFPVQPVSFVFSLFPSCSACFLSSLFPSCSACFLPVQPVSFVFSLFPVQPVSFLFSLLFPSCAACFLSSLCPGLPPDPGPSTTRSSPEMGLGSGVFLSQFDAVSAWVSSVYTAMFDLRSLGGGGGVKVGADAISHVARSCCQNVSFPLFTIHPLSGRKRYGEKKSPELLIAGRHTRRRKEAPLKEQES
ncbi:unnamed protein product [Boreogadus saida]